MAQNNGEKVMNKRILTLAVASLCLMLSGQSFSADGIIKDMYPPTNDGTHNGAGMIEGDDGSSYVFQIPGDNNGELLNASDAIFYTLSDDGQHIASVSQINPDKSKTYRGESVRMSVDIDATGNTVTYIVMTYADGGESKPIIIKPGQKVYVTEGGPKGLNAISVKVV